MRTVHSLQGNQLHGVLQAATAWLEQNAELIDSLNVFPVPDGDTGSNMAMSMRAGLRESAATAAGGAGAVARAFARGALVGARGNSGIILSQLWQGLAIALGGDEELSVDSLAAGLRAASSLAAAAVARPAEGTILTVMKDIAEAAAGVRSDGDLLAFLREIVRVAGRSVARTPELMPMLREAGVVDAGAQGLFVILEGAVRHLESGDGGPPAVALPPADRREPGESAVERAADAGEAYGSCIEFMLAGPSLDLHGIRDVLERSGTSVIVTGGADIVRVHLHSRDPAGVLRAAAGLGKPVEVRIRDMDRQHADLLRRDGERREVPVAVIAAVCGDGLADIFMSLGASRTVCFDRDPLVAAGQLLGSVESVAAATVVFLPNDPAVLAAVEEMRTRSPKPMLVIPARSIGQGLAAMVAFTGGPDADEIARGMTAALPTARSVEVRPGAVAPRVLAFLDGEQVAEGDDVGAVLDQALGRVQLESAQALTLFRGSGLDEGQASAICARLEDGYPRLRVELHDGGQPQALLIAAVES